LIPCHYCTKIQSDIAAFVVYRFATVSFFVPRMTQVIMSCNSSSDGYQQVTAKSDLISQSAVLYRSYFWCCCISHVLHDLCNKFWHNMYTRNFLLTLYKIVQSRVQKTWYIIKNILSA